MTQIVLCNDTLNKLVFLLGFNSHRMAVVDSCLHCLNGDQNNVTQRTFILLDVPHTVTISLHVLIMQRVSKLYTVISYVFTPNDTSACLLPRIATKYITGSNSNANVYAVAVVHAGSMHGLVRDCSNSIANSLESLQSCTKPSIGVTKVV